MRSEHRWLLGHLENIDQFSSIFIYCSCDVISKKENTAINFCHMSVTSVCTTVCIPYDDYAYNDFLTIPIFFLFSI